MTYTTKFLSTSALALLLGMGLSYASDITAEKEGDEDVTVTLPVVVIEEASDEGGASSAASAVSKDEFAKAVKASHVNHKWWDVDGDGDLDLDDVKAFFKKRLKHLDFDGDGDFDVDDIIAGAKSLWKNVKGIFDADNNGTVEFDEILIGTNNAIGIINDLVDRISNISGTIKGSPYFDSIPDSVKGPLTNLLALVDEAAGKTKGGLNIGGKYVSKIEDALKALNSQIKTLTSGDLSATDFIKARKDIFAYLEMVKGWYNTGDNASLITKIERRLAKLKTPTV